VLAESVKVCHGVAAAHGLHVEAVAEALYPVTVNDGAEVLAVQAAVEDVYGADRFVTLPHPVAGSEDFSRVLDAVPGAMVFLGACPPDRDPATAPFNHAAEAAFDDAVLADGVGLYAEFALRQLTASEPPATG
jgi:hippurate hydrolase